MKKIALYLVLGLFCSYPLIAKEYMVDSTHTSIGFNVKHMSISNVKGNFNNFKGTIEVDGKMIKALEGEIEIASINTNSQKRDEHLRAADFFDAQKFPTATLSLIKHNGKKLEANLTMKGITKKVVFQVELRGPTKHLMTGKDLVAVSLSGKLNRKDFDIGTDTKNVVVGDDVDVMIDIEAIEK